VDENSDPNLQAVGSSLVVDNGKSKQTFSDLDELIVNHVQAMARKTEELMAHEKFKGGSEDELRTQYLRFFLRVPDNAV
jgi:transcription elongation factor SPT6